MKPGVAFFSGAVLGVAGAYLYKNYESGKELKGGDTPAKRFTPLDRIISDGSTATKIEAFCSKYSKKYSCINGVLFNKDKTVLLKYPSSKRSSTYIIPDSVTSIGEEAFSNCTLLESITIPASVTSINTYSIDRCDSLTNIFVNKNNKVYSSMNGVLFKNDQTELLIYPCAKTDKFYEIPSSVTSIGNDAFSRCVSLETVTIPTSSMLTSIGDGAFNGCTGITTITIPSASVTSIGDFAFYGCSSLTSITIPASVKSIGDEAFYGCTSLETITIPNGVTSIGNYAFQYCSSLTPFKIPPSVTTIGESAFKGCINLTSITIPSSVTSIGNDAFFNCTSLETIVIPSTLITTIKVSKVFYACNLTNIKDEKGASYKIVKDKFVLQ